MICFKNVETDFGFAKFFLTPSSSRIIPTGRGRFPQACPVLDPDTFLGKSIEPDNSAYSRHACGCTTSDQSIDAANVLLRSTLS